MVCKISGSVTRKVGLLWRFGLYIQNGAWDEFMNRQEIMFFEKIVPLMKGTNYSHPKLFFVGKATA